MNASKSQEEVLHLAKTRKKYSLGSDVDKEAVFDFSFMHDIETVSFIQEFGKVMFLIRGPPGTGKATLSEMIAEKYPTAVHCCADHYFENSFVSPERNRQSLKASHDYCQNKAKEACATNTNIVVVQNTHMRKWEMQCYIDLAASYNYTVIMAVTLYRFNVSPEALLANNTDGLNLSYFRNRLRQWEDMTPVSTGWFLGPKDSAHLLSLAQKSVQELIGDGKFCRVFNIYSIDDFMQSFKARRLLYCIAGYAAETFQMKKYYLSPIVQYLYGKCFSLTVLGYHVTPTVINAIVKVDDIMQLLMFGQDSEDNLGSLLHNLDIRGNTVSHNETCSFDDYKEPDTSSLTFEDWEDDEFLSASNYTFINLACKNGYRFNTSCARKEFDKSLSKATGSESCDDLFIELDGGVKVCRLEENEWLVKGSKKVILKSVFSGLYV